MSSDNLQTKLVSLGVLFFIIPIKEILAHKVFGIYLSTKF